MYALTERRTEESKRIRREVMGKTGKDWCPRRGIDNMKYFSMFSGIGGFELGIGEFGECVGYSEIDKYAVGLYKKHFKGVKNYGDATKIKTGELPDFDLLVGGFPCQAFSISGRKCGFNDTRGTLFFEIARVLADKKPKHILLENVKGLLSHDGGKSFQTIIRVLTDLGYRIQWEVLNSKDFGVPQNRERLFIVGYLGNGSRQQVFPIGKSSRGHIRKIIDTGHEATRIHDPDGISIAQKAVGGGQGAKTGLYAVALTERRTEEAKRIRREAMQKTGKDWCPRRGKELTPRKDKFSNCLTTGQTKEHYLAVDGMVRRLTPVECERLQGFPDNWTKGISDTQRYKCIGNAVTVNVIKAIIEVMFGEY